MKLPFDSFRARTQIGLLEQLRSEEVKVLVHAKQPLELPFVNQRAEFWVCSWKCLLSIPLPVATIPMRILQRAVQKSIQPYSRNKGGPKMCY